MWKFACDYSHELELNLTFGLRWLIDVEAVESVVAPVNLRDNIHRNPSRFPAVIQTKNNTGSILYGNIHLSSFLKFSLIEIKVKL